ncbi:DUF421 domain-containing protein [Dactylosporangium sp. CA-139114]|uniref:DUF421 domain-containing protein n=1 Tax=Dactylosporangium sp. CA-139114 TaxID=3239931 RepID=UPI003D98F2DC
MLGVGSFAAATTAAGKALVLFLVAAVVFRFTQRRALADLAPFDWVVAAAIGAVIGRTATARDTAWTTGAAALLALLAAHAVIERLRFAAPLRRLLDPPTRVLIRDGRVDERALRRSGLTRSDLDAVLRSHGHTSVATVRLAVFEAQGGISVLARPVPPPSSGERQ